MAGNRPSINKKTLADFTINSLLYFTLALTFLLKFGDFKISEQHLLWPVFYLNTQSLPWVLQLTRFCLCFCPFLTLFPRTRTLGQALTLFAALQYISISYSNGKFYHAGLIWMVFFFSYIPARIFFSTSRACHFSYFFACLSYFNSGLWKLRAIINHILVTKDLDFLFYSLQEHIAAAAIERVKAPTFLGQLIMDNAWVSLVAWIMAVSVELSAALIPFFARHTFVFSLIFLVFHIMVFFVMRIYFMTAIYFHCVMALYFYLKRDEFIKFKKY